MSNSEFPQRYQELIEEHHLGNKTKAAVRVGVTPSHVSHLTRGVYKPSREFMERLIEEYGLDREAWLGYAGMGRKVAPPEPVDDRDDIARRAAEATIALLRLSNWPGIGEQQASGAEHLWRGLVELSGEFDLAEIPGNAPLTPESAAKILEALREHLGRRP